MPTVSDGYIVPNPKLGQEAIVYTYPIQNYAGCEDCFSFSLSILDAQGNQPVTKTFFLKDHSYYDKNDEYMLDIIIFNSTKGLLVEWKSSCDLLAYCLSLPTFSPCSTGLINSLWMQCETLVSEWLKQYHP